MLQVHPDQRITA